MRDFTPSEKDEIGHLRKRILGGLSLSLASAVLGAVLLSLGASLVAAVPFIASYVSLVGTFVKLPGLVRLFRGKRFAYILPFVAIIFVGAFATFAAGSVRELLVARGASPGTYGYWIAPAFEEAFKIGGVLVLAIDLRGGDLGSEVPQPLLLAGALWAGYSFGLIETIGNPSYLASIAPRLIGSIPGHAIWTFIVGLGIVVGFFRLSFGPSAIAAPALAYVMAVLLHGFWNQSLFSTGAQVGFFAVWLVLVLVTCFWVVFSSRSPKRRGEPPGNSPRS